MKNFLIDLNTLLMYLSVIIIIITSAIYKTSENLILKAFILKTFYITIPIFFITITILLILMWIGFKKFLDDNDDDYNHHFI